MAELSAQAVFDKAFSPGREPRSDAYKQGVMHALRVRIDGVDHGKYSPHVPGSSEADASPAAIAAGPAISPVARASALFELFQETHTLTRPP